MGAKPEAATTESPKPGPEESASWSAVSLSEQLSALAQHFTAAFGQLSELDAELRRRLEDLERREADIAARAAALDEYEQQLEQRHQELENKRVAGEELQTKLQAQLEDLEHKWQQFAAQQAELARRYDELTASEMALQQREQAVGKFQQAVAKFQQALAQMPDTFGGDDEPPARPAPPPHAPLPPQAESPWPHNECPTESQSTQTPAAGIPREMEPPADDVDAASSETDASPLAAHPEAVDEGVLTEPQGNELFTPHRAEADAPTQADDEPPATQQVLEAEPDMGDNLDTIDFTNEELEKLQILRRLRPNASEAQLIAHIRADRSGSSNGPTRGLGGKSKRRWR